MSPPVPQRPVILAIGGSDCAGMAGIQADQRAITALGGHAATAISAVTAQNSDAVLAVNPIPPETLAAQISACLDLSPAAIKIGLLATVGQVRTCAGLLDREGIRGKVPVVLDPVLASSSGQALAGEGVGAAIRELLLPRCALVTPNRHEAASLLARSVTAQAESRHAAKKLAALGADAVLLKGGHWHGTVSSDYFHGDGQTFWLSSPRREAIHQRGTGCTLAAAMATALALGHRLADAVVIGKMAVNQGLRQAYGWPTQQGPVLVDAFPDCPADLPAMTLEPPEVLDVPAFPEAGIEPLGLYPVVDRAAWLETLLPAGISTIQLRIKDLDGESLRRETLRAIQLAELYDARLFINDHWRLAIELGAYGVHLGQDDLATADLAAIRDAGLRLGISTHCHYEVARAIGHRPSYIACGPVYPTTTKQMPWTPHGPEGLAYWRRVLRDYPLVAIGGIDRDRLPAVRAAGPDGIAMVTALTLAGDPHAAAVEFMAVIAATSSEGSQL